MIDQIKDLTNEIKSYAVATKEELEAFRLEFLSRNGRVQSMFKNLGSVPKEERGAVGKAMNEAKQLAQHRFEELKNALESSEQSVKAAVDDITLPAPEPIIGSLHPLTQTLSEMKNIFYRLGLPSLMDLRLKMTSITLPRSTSHLITLHAMNRIPSSYAKVMTLR